MKLSQIRAIRSGCVFVAVLAALVSSKVQAAAPAWWAQRGVLNSAATPDDYAAVNQGQVRNIARQAYNEMTVRLSGGAGATLDAIWANPAASTDDYRTVNLGQLKNVAKPFYDRLSLAYPWSASTSPADDYALANTGQVKQLFSFPIGTLAPPPGDSDNDGLPDTWETQYFGTIAALAGEDSDGDGLSNLAEYQQGRNPVSADNPTLHFTLFAPSAR